MNKAREERIKKAIARYTEKATRSPEAARRTLVREGIYLENGELAPAYSGGKNAA